MKGVDESYEPMCLSGFRDICGQDNYTMMLSSKKLTVTHVSTHVSMEQAVRQVKKDRVYNVIKLTYDALKSYIADPRIAVFSWMQLMIS